MIKHLLSLTFVFSVFFSSAQITEATSFYFSTPQPTSAPEVKHFDENLTGVYRLEEESHTKMVVYKDSITSKYFIVFPLTMKEVESNESYYIKDELLYGIAPTGLFFKNKNDTLIVALNQEVLFCNPKDVVVKRDGNTYYINEKIMDGRWSTKIVEFSGKNLILSEFDHDLAEKELNTIEKDIVLDEELKIVIASPSKDEFIGLTKSKGYKQDTLKFKRD